MYALMVFNTSITHATTTVIPNWRCDYINGINALKEAAFESATNASIFANLQTSGSLLFILYKAVFFVTPNMHLSNVVSSAHFIVK